MFPSKCGKNSYIERRLYCIRPKYSAPITMNSTGMELLLEHYDGWEEDLADCPDEFGFLKKTQVVTLRQDEKVKSLYVISYTDQDGKHRDKVCTAAEREKVERFLIEHPQVRYLDCLGCYA